MSNFRSMSSTFKNPLNFYLYPLGSNNLFTQSYINWWRTDFFTILNCKVDLSCLQKVRKHTWSQDTRGWTSIGCPGGCDHQGWGSEESFECSQVGPGTPTCWLVCLRESRWETVTCLEGSRDLVSSPIPQGPLQLWNPSHLCFMRGKTWWG